MKTKATANLISKNRDVLGGTPVFSGTRVPVQTLFDYLEGNFSLKQFLTDFPSVKKIQALAVLKTAEKLVVSK